MSITRVFAVLLTLGLSSLSPAAAAGFDPEEWDLTRAVTSTHLDRESLAGFAWLKDSDFHNGVIEVDLAVNGSRSYPGIVFRMGFGG